MWLQSTGTTIARKASRVFIFVDFPFNYEERMNRRRCMDSLKISADFDNFQLTLLQKCQNRGACAALSSRAVFSYINIKLTSGNR